LSVTRTLGAKPCFLSSLRVSFPAEAFAPSLHQQIENLALVVDRAREPELPARNHHGHLVEMPP
jgi:hypothetical protein